MTSIIIFFKNAIGKTYHKKWEMSTVIFDKKTNKKPVDISRRVSP